MPIKATPEQQLRFLSRDVLPLLDAVCNGFTTDPGTSDLYDEQPIHVSITLGDYRRASRLRSELSKMERASPLAPLPRGIVHVAGNPQIPAEQRCVNCGTRLCDPNDPPEGS